VDAGHAYQANAGVGQLTLDESFNLLAQGLTDPAAVVLESALLQLSPQVKTHENIRKLAAGLGSEVLLSRTNVRTSKYRGNRAIATMRKLGPK
jgi:hypothetical protein